jgi:hypothetical protein
MIFGDNHGPDCELTADNQEEMNWRDSMDAAMPDASCVLTVPLLLRHSGREPNLNGVEQI